MRSMRGAQNSSPLYVYLRWPLPAVVFGSLHMEIKHVASFLSLYQTFLSLLKKTKTKLLKMLTTLHFS